MVWRRLLKSFGAWTTLQSWNEPWFFRARLRGDLGLRLTIAGGVGLAGAGLLLGLFAVNAGSPHPLHGVWGFLVFGGLVALHLLRGKSTAGGRVRICEEGIVRSRNYIWFITQWLEDASWTPESLLAVAIAPSSAIGRPFHLLLLATQDRLDVIGIPARIDLAQLAATLGRQRITVQAVQEIPESLRRPMPWPFAPVVAVVGICLFLFGGVFYAVTHWIVPRAGEAPPVAVRPAPPVVAPNGGFVPPAFRPAPPPAADLSLPPLDFRPPPAAPADSPLPPPPVAPPAAPPPVASPPVVPGAAPTPPSFVPPRLPPRTTPMAPSRPLPGRPGGSAGRRTELLGGPGGVEFERSLPGGATVVGFRYRMGRWLQKEALGALDPLASRDAPGPSSIVAKEGYVVGGLQVDADDLVRAVRIIFVREVDGRLDKSDHYFSDWIGSPTGVAPRPVGDGVTRVIGVCGRRGVVFDAIGLVLEGS